MPGPWQLGETHTTAGMGSDVYVGIGLSAHSNGDTATATFDNVSITGFTPRTAPSAAQLTPAANNQAGSLFARNPVDVTHFTTTFTFQMNATTPAAIADGMTFTIQNAPAGTERAESVLKLSTTGSGTALGVADYFTPYDWRRLDNNDADLGSGGTMLLPDAVGSAAHPHLMVETGKTGRLYLIDRDNMGQFNARYDQVVQTVQIGGPGVWGNAAFLQDGPNTGLIYYWGQSAPGLAYRITNGVINPTPVRTPFTFAFPGSQPSISSNGMDGSTALMWALRSDNYGSNGPETLYAFNGESLGQPLWVSSDVTGRDAIGGTSVKFVFPIVTNGHVYAGSNGTLAVYGLLPSHDTAPGIPANFQVSQLPPDQGGDTKLQLSWTSPDDATLIKIERSTAGPDGPWTQLAQVDPAQSTFVNTGLTPVTHYWYRIRAANQAGNSDYTDVMDALTRLAGARLSVTKVTSGEVDLTWTSVISAAAGNHFNVERSTDNFTTFTTIASGLPTSQLSFVDTTVVRPNTYQYRVHAFNVSPADESFSNIVAAVVAPVDIEYPFPNGIQTTNGLQFNGSAMYSADEQLIRLNNDVSQQGSVFTTNRVSATKFTTTFWVRLHEGTQPNPADGFTFTIQATGPTALGTGGSGLGYQNIGRSVAIKFDVFQNSGDPSNNSTGLFTNGQAPIGGTAINSAVVNLRDQHRKRIDISYDVSTLQLNVTITDEQHDGGPTSVSQTYTVNIPAVLGTDGAYVGFTGGTGGNFSLQDVLGWVLPPTAPAGPSNLQVAAGASDATLTWTVNSTNENGFVIERSTDNYHFSQAGQVGVGATTFHDTGLSPSTIYFYRVRAVNDVGMSAPSNVVQATVGATIITIDHSDGFTSSSDLQANGNAMFAPLPGAVGIFTAHQDIGAVATLGNATFASGVYTLRASGDDIFGTADAFHFVYMPLHGNGQIIARVTGLDPTGTISDTTKAGVMIRETLANDSREVSLVDTRDHSFRFQRRADPAGSTDRGPDSDYPDLTHPLPPPLWLRLQRQGNVFTASWAIDVGGMPGAWTQLDGPQTITMASDVFIGLALTAHNNDGSLNTATFDHVTVDTGAAAVLTDGGGSEAGSIFKTQPVPVTGTFNSSFTLNVRPTSGSADGFTFVLQADPSGPTALGASGGSLGYGGISPSVAIKLDLYSQGSHHSTTGLYFNGATGSAGQIDMTSAGIDFRQNHTYKMDLNYDGFTLTETLKDLVSGATFTTSYVLNLRAAIGQDTAYVGFTGGTGGEAAVLAVTSWTATFNPVAAPPHLEVTSFPATVSGAPQVFTVSARTANGQPLTNYRGTVHFTSTDSRAILPDDYTFTAADNGTHTFAGVLFTVGSQSITATDNTPFALTDAQTNIQVNPRSFALSGFPSPITAGDQGTFTVTALDYFGNVAAGYLGTVHFTSSDPLARSGIELPADYTFTEADGGTHIFTATLKTAGTQSITVADPRTPGIDRGTQSGIVVTPAAPARIQFTNPSTVTAGTVTAITLTVQDAYGNTVTDYTGTVHIMASNGAMADYMFTPGDMGTHTFTRTLRVAGTLTITATDQSTGLTGMTSIIVTPGAAAAFVVFGYPSPVQVGTVNAFSVRVVDAYGNTVTGYRGTVFFISDDPNALFSPAYTFTDLDNGIHTFTGMFMNTGTHYIRAVDAIMEGLAGEQDGIMVV
jgi:hypothetical protein